MMLLGLGFPTGGCRAGPAWPHIKAVWAADFLNDRYAMRRRASSSLLTTTRSSSHLLTDANGIFRTFAANELVRNNSVGAYAGGQVTPLMLANTNLLSNAIWSQGGYVAARATLAGTRLGIFSRVQYTCNQSNVINSRVTQSGSVASTNPHFLSIYYEPGTSGSIHIELGNNGGLFIIYGPAGNLTTQVYSGNPGVLSNVTDVLTADGVTRKITAKWTPAAAGLVMLGIGPRTLVSGQTIIYCGADIQPVGYETPFIVSGSSAATRYASDVRAADMNWFNAAGLISGASELVVPAWSHVSDAVERPLFEYSDGTASNYIRGYVDAADKPALKIVSGGLVQTTTALPASIAKGRKPLAFGWNAGGGYVADNAGNVATFGAIALPAVTQKRLGGSVAGNYLNDIIEADQCCRLLSQAEAQHWAVAA